MTVAEAIPQLARRICRVTSNPDVDHMVKTLERLAGNGGILLPSDEKLNQHARESWREGRSNYLEICVACGKKIRVDIYTGTGGYFDRETSVAFMEVGKSKATANVLRGIGLVPICIKCMKETYDGRS